MDKSLIMFIAVGIAFLYFVTNFVGDIQKEDEVFQSSDYKEKHKYNQYYTTDSIGQDIIDVTLADPKTQLEAWNRSQVKNEFLELFPDFDTMKAFIKNRVRGEELIRKLTGKVNEVEDKFFSGTMNAEQAQRALEHIK
jgi:uncharacterized protein YpmS